MGVDGKGSVPPLFIHWDQKNAQWLSDGKYGRFRFNDAYAVMPEVVGHEYTHAIVQEFGQLVAGGQPGALNEAIADVFGIAFRHWLGRSENNWVLGDGLRDPSHHFTMQSYKTGRSSDDNVHDNSRIPSHAFYCAVQWTKTHSYGAIARVWFRALKDVSKTSSFREFALATLRHTNRFQDMAIASGLVQSWVHVGVLVAQVAKPVVSPPKPQLVRIA